MNNSASARQTVTGAIQRLASQMISQSTLIDLKAAIHRPIELRSRLVQKEYYESQTDITFRSLHAAEKHYLETGWQEGLLPNQFCWAPEARTDIYASRTVRAWVLDTAGAVEPALRLIHPAYAHAVPRAKRRSGGVVGHQLGQRPSQLRTALFRSDDGQDLTWDDVIQRTRHNRMVYRAIAGSTLFDQEYYSVQLGVPFLSRSAAINHYIECGEALGYSPSPLFEPEWYLAHLVEYQADPTENQLFHFLTIGQDAPASPVFDGHRYTELHPDASDHEGGATGHFLARAAEGEVETCPTDPDIPHPLWETVRERALSDAGVYSTQRTLVGEGLVRARRPAAPPEDAPDTTDTGSSQPWGTVSILVRAEQISRGSLDAANDISRGSVTDWELLIAGSAEEILPHRRFIDALLAQDERFRLVVTTARGAAALNEAALQGAQRAITLWNGEDRWASNRLAQLLAGGLPRDGITFIHRVWSELTADSDSIQDYPATLQRLWQGPQSLAGLLVSGETFVRAGMFSTDLSDLLEWEFYIRTAESAPGHSVPQMPARPGTPHPPLSPRESQARGHILARYLGDRDTLRRLPERNNALTSVVLYVSSGWQPSLTSLSAIRSVLGAAIEIVVVVDGGPRSIVQMLSLATLTDPRVRIIRLPSRVGRSVALTHGAVHARGGTLVLVDEHVLLSGEWPTELAAPLRENRALAVQPLLLDRDDTVLSAGTIFPASGTVPVALLAGFPREDAAGGTTHSLVAVHGWCMAVQAASFGAAGGFEPTLIRAHADTDLCLRMTSAAPGMACLMLPALTARSQPSSTRDFSRQGGLEGEVSTRESDVAQLAADATVFQRRWGGRNGRDDTTIVAEYGFSNIQVVAGRTLPATRVRPACLSLSRPQRSVASGPAAGLPVLRWAIKNPAHAGVAGDAWGDTFFADDLAAGLRALGQEVVIDRQPAHERPHSDYLDDVTISLRGLERFVPQPGATNILWVISHPELVTADELRSGFDLVYAASTRWSETASEAYSMRVRPLLQATNTARFRTRAGDAAASDHDVLFVGRTRNVFRPIVRDAIAADAKLAVYGDDGWERFIPTRFIAASTLPNSALPAAYRNARIVLNDHWDVMAEQGFFSNRLFDAVASGARVVSDPIDGLDDLFHGTVQAYHGVDDLRELLAPDSRRWPSEAAFSRAAQSVALEHSFERRAATLLGDVLTARGIPHSL